MADAAAADLLFHLAIADEWEQARGGPNDCGADRR
jgi:hypothetical protein